jgi:spore germination cell wall hydrolase CwlJ-like protein
MKRHNEFLSQSKGFIKGIVLCGIAGAFIIQQISHPIVPPAPQLPKITIDDEKQIVCLAKNIYYEARDQSPDGQFGVAMVTLNRVADQSRFQHTVCDVVFAGEKDKKGKYIKNRCQFSWVCDGNPRIVRIEDQHFQAALLIAYYSYYCNHFKMKDITQGAEFYHNLTVNPQWAANMDQTIKIDQHIFYKD